MTDFLQFDREIFIFLNNLGSPSFDAFWKLISNKLIWIPFYAILLFILFRNFKLKSMIFILIFVAIGVTISDQMASIFKNGIERLRPCHEPTLEGLIREVECAGKYGFYSAHASSSFFLATFISMLLKKKYGWFPFVLFVWAAIVSYSRIYLGVHYPFDVVMGATMGFLIGGFCATLSLNVIRKQNL